MRKLVNVMKKLRVTAFVLAVALVTSTFFTAGGGSIFAAVRPVYIDDADYWTFDAPAQAAHAFTSQNINLANADLSSGTSASGFTYSSSVGNWTSDSNNNKSNISGVLNTLQFPKWKNDNTIEHLEYLKVSPNHGLDNPNVFVMASGANNTESIAGFTSEPVEFAAGGYYSVSVKYYAVQSFGSFYLIPGEQFDNGSTPRIELTQAVYSNGGINNIPYENADGTLNVASNESAWGTAEFLVKTDILAPQTFTVGLYLGSQTSPSKGVIYFQNPSITQLSRDAYEQKKANPDTNLYEQTEIEIDDKSISESNYKRSDRLYQYDTETESAVSINETNPIYNFVPQSPKDEDTNDAHFGAFARKENTSRIPSVLNFKEVDDVVLPHSAGDDDIWLLAANNSNASFKLDKPFVVKQHQIYMINFYTLSAGGENATLRVRDIRHKNNIVGTYDSGNINIKTDGSDTINGWALNTVFLVGESYFDINVDIEFWVGTEDGAVTDYMLMDGFKIRRVSAEYYQQHRSTASSDMVLDTNETTNAISNSYFNLGVPASVDAPYPLTANNWTVSKPDNNNLALSGIVNTNPVHWNEYSGNPSNYGLATSAPGSIGTKNINNNVYMMQNKGTTWQTLSSNSFGLYTGVTTLIEFDAARQFRPFQGMKFWAAVESNGREIVRIDLGKSSNAEGSGEWETISWKHYAFAIKDSAVTSREVTITFNMGSEEWPSASAIAYIDNVCVTQTDNQDSASYPDGYAYADLTDPKKFFEAEDPTMTHIGLYDDVLHIANYEDTKKTSVKNTLTETLDGASFYEYTFRVKILDVEKNYITKIDNDGYNVTDYGTEYESGINFRLDGFEGGLENINYADIQQMYGLDKDGFAELKFVIRPDEQSELALVIEFGNDYMAVCADVFIKDISFRKIETEDEFKRIQDAYNEAKNNGNALGYKHVSIITESYKAPEDTEGTGSTADVDWWYVVPSIIMGIAILLALALYLLRRFKFKVHIDKRHTTYASDDRSARKD